LKKGIVLTALFLACLSATMLPQLAAQLGPRRIISQSEEGYLDLYEPWNVSGVLRLDWKVYAWHTVRFWDCPGFNITEDNTELDLNGHRVMFNQTVLSPGPTGITIIDKSEVTIRNGTIIGFQFGIWVERSSEVNLTLNNVFASTKKGIAIRNSKEVDLAFNNVSGSGEDGINIDGNSSEIAVLNNHVSGSGDVGIGIYENSNVAILNNTITSNDREGIHMMDSNHNVIGGNEISKNNFHGIYLYNSNNNTIYNNTVMNNQPGAIYMEMANQNIFYHNNLPGPQDTQCVKSKGIWDIGYGAIGDVGFGGNYWSKYEGVDIFSGKNQDVPGSDGIGDTAYRIDEDDQDRYPILKPWGSMLTDFNLTCIVSGEEKTRQVAVFSNSSIASFKFNKTERLMSFTAYNGTFCKVIIPKEALDGSFLVMTNDALTACVLHWDGTHHFVDFSLTAKNSNVKIKGEIAIRGDINGDGKVSIVDISMAAKNYGKGT